MHNRLANMRRNCTRGAYLASLLACALIACGDRAPTRQVEFSDCRLAKLASTARCATIDVPEDRTAPGGRRIAIAVTLLPANTLSPKADPLFMLAGGPGQSSAALAPFAGMLGGVRRNRDIVLVDPRGTGKSSPLRCAALAPRDPFDDFSNVDIADAAQRCLREIKAAGEVDVAQYTTSALVADIDAVRAALGYERINLWGGSYGTRVAQEYLRRYPQHVRTMVLDGVAPPGLAHRSRYLADARRRVDAVVCGMRRAAGMQARPSGSQCDARRDRQGTRHRTESDRCRSKDR